MSKPGLGVVDCYQAWCGPCKPMAGLFRRLKIEISSELLNFAKVFIFYESELVDTYIKIFLKFCKKRCQIIKPL